MAFVGNILAVDGFTFGVGTSVAKANVVVVLSASYYQLASAQCSS